MGWEAGRLSEVTVLIADCRNFTGLTAERGADYAARTMDRFFRLSHQVVIKYDGIIDKFLGDGCLALFNVPVRRDDHQLRAVSAAQEIQEAVRRMNAEQGADLAVGISVGTGFAIAGRIGSDHPSQYTAIGDVVNTTARLQSVVEAGDVLVTAEVYRVIDDLFPGATSQVHSLKGLPKPVETYLLRR